MSIVGEVLTRLQAITPAFAIVSGAVELAAVKGRPNALPAAYAYIRQEMAGPNLRMTGPVLQPLELDVAVVVITENLSDLAGDELGEDLEVLKVRVRDALLGMVPGGTQDGTPVEYVSAEVVKIGAGVVWCEMVFSASLYICEAGAADPEPDSQEDIDDGATF